MAKALKISVDSKQVDAALLKKIRKLRKPEPALKDMALYMVRSVKRNFKAQGRPTKWKQSQRAKRERGETLSDTGNLRGSISYMIAKSTAMVGTNVLYARIHQFGGTIQRPDCSPYIITDIGPIFMKKDGRYPAGTKFTKPHAITMPARPFLMFQRADYKALNKIMLRHLER